MPRQPEYANQPRCPKECCGTGAFAHNRLVKAKRKTLLEAWLCLCGVTCSSRPGNPRCRLSLIHLWSSSPGPACHQWGMPTPAAAAEPALDWLYLALSGAQVWIPRGRPLRQAIKHGQAVSKETISS